MQRLASLVLIMFQLSEAVIYRLNETEYSRMPKMYTMDNYELCMSESDGVFCTLDLELVSDTPSTLMDLIREYSEDTTKHYNHSILQRGICMSRTCKEYINTNLQQSAEACLNETLWKEYQLKSKVLRIKCLTPNDKADVNVGDVVFAVVVGVILLLNFIGTVYDRFSNSDRTSVGYKALLCFSVVRSWQLLLAAPSPDMSPRLKRLKIFHSLRSVIALLVVTAHALVSLLVYVDNTYYIENMYYHIENHLFLNGSLVIQVFFIMSGFLITFNMKIYAEEHEVCWNLFFKVFIWRWMRLAPAYAIVIGFVSTWARLLGSGPVWHIAISDETYDCQQNWWKHLLFVNNYFDGSRCLLHSWYMASDMQLFMLGIIIAIACKSTRSRVIVLSSLATTGFLLPAVHIYFQDLEGIVLASPTTAAKLYVNNKTFDNLYKRAHNHLFGFVTGMSMGYFVYYLQEINFDIQKYRKYRIIYWLLIPLGMGLIMTGSVFHRDAPRPSMVIRILYGTLVKPIFCVLAAVLICGAIFKIENLFRGLLEWRGWVMPGKLAYSAFILHLTLVELFIATDTTPTHLTLKKQIMHSISMCVISFLFAIPLYIFVEVPFRRLSRISEAKENTEDIECVKGEHLGSSFTLKIK